MGSLKLFDLVKFTMLDSSLMKVKDDYAGAFKPRDPNQQEHISGMGNVAGQQPPQMQQNGTQAKGLLVRIAATHSGLITRNNGFYLPEKMKKGADTWTANYGKPILLHHNDHKDPVGRIVAATYRDTSGSIADKFKDGLEVKNKQGKVTGKITDTLINDFASGKMPFGMQVDIVTSLLRDSVLDDQGYDGLGYIELVADIVDPEAIQKLLDGRYLTGSVGATTDAAVCSVCRMDWTDAGPCEHRPGAIYDGAKCFIIAGNLVYDEYSFVNTPADRHSKVLELNYNGIQDKVQLEFQYTGKIADAKLGFPQYDSKEEPGMKTGKTADVKDSATTTETTDATTVTTPVETAPATETTVETPAAETTTEVVVDSTTEGTETVVAPPAPAAETTTTQEVADEQKALLDKIAKLEETNKELRDRLDANRKEYTALFQEFEALQDSLVTEKKQTRKAKESVLSTLRALRDHKIDSAQDLSTVSDSDLQTEIDQALKVVDMVKITDKLGDGMSRTPSGEVTSPVEVKDVTTNQKRTVDVKDLKEIEDNFLAIRLSKGQRAAEAYLDTMKRQGRLPQE